MADYMTSCQQCGAEEAFPFKCKYCGKALCGEHRLPERHTCVSKEIMNSPSGLYESNSLPPSRLVKRAGYMAHYICYTCQASFESVEPAQRHERENRGHQVKYRVCLMALESFVRRLPPDGKCRQHRRNEPMHRHGLSYLSRSSGHCQGSIHNLHDYTALGSIMALRSILCHELKLIQEILTYESAKPRLTYGRILGFSKCQ